MKPACPDCTGSSCPSCRAAATPVPPAELITVTQPDPTPLTFTPGTYYYGSVPHKCPVCDGSGLVSRPPHIAGDVATWSASGTITYPCKPCEGKGVLWS